MCVPKITIIRYIIPEIPRTTHRICCHFGPFFALFHPNNPKNQNFEKMKKNSRRYFHVTHVYHKWQSYDVWFLRYGVWWTEFFVILNHFLPFYPPNNPKNLNFEKMKETTGDIIILHSCTNNDNHMIYGSWDIKCNRQNFLSLWTIFCPFTLLKTQKIKILKKWKKFLETSSFYTNTSKIMIICYTIPEIWCTTDVILIFYFGLFLATPHLPPCIPHPPPAPPLINQKKQKIKITKKWKKNPGDITLPICIKNNDHMMYSSSNMVHNGQMDRQMDRQMEKVI